MCNRYENERTAASLAELIHYPLQVRDDARAWEPHAYMAPQTSGLCIVQHDGDWVLRTAHWSFLRHEPPKREKKPRTKAEAEARKALGDLPPLKPKKPTPVFNTRSDRCPAELLPFAYRSEAPAIPSLFWRGLQFCWLPATAWLECPQPRTWIRMHLEGESFLLAGVCGERDGIFRMSMTMTETPDFLPAIKAGHSRMPLAFALDALGQVDPKPIHDRIVVDAV
ncbi:MAG: hypothetical protein QM757_44065 [Paludibaculum sp.]